MAAAFVVVCATLCSVQTGWSEQNGRSTAPPRVINVAPPIGSATRSVDAVTVVKSQLRECEEKGQALETENDGLKKTVSDLQKQTADLQKQKAELEKALSQFTTLGGSSVKAYCKSETVSSNTAGATSNCSSMGYMCEPVSGLCRTSCSATQGQCASGFFCDTPSARCVVP